MKVLCVQSAGNWVDEIEWPHAKGWQLKVFRPELFFHSDVHRVTPSIITNTANTSLLLSPLSFVLSAHIILKQSKFQVELAWLAMSPKTAQLHTAAIPSSAESALLAHPSSWLTGGLCSTPAQLPRPFPLNGEHGVCPQEVLLYYLMSWALVQTLGPWLPLASPDVNVSNTKTSRKTRANSNSVHGARFVN